MRSAHLRNGTCVVRSSSNVRGEKQFVYCCHAFSIQPGWSYILLHAPFLNTRRSPSRYERQKVQMASSCSHEPLRKILSADARTDANARNLQAMHIHVGLGERRRFCPSPYLTRPPPCSRLRTSVVVSFAHNLEETSEQTQ